MAIYVCSDLHGQRELFHKALEQIGFSDDDHMYIIGDAIDRGPDSIPLLLEIMDKGNMTLVLGNHEYMMIQYLRGHTDGRPWTLSGNGGRKTLYEYNLLSDQDRKRMQQYLEDLPLQIELEAGGRIFLLSHSAFLRDHGTCRWMDVTVDDSFRTVWYSPWRFLEHFPRDEYKADGREHIIGHVPTAIIPKREWREGIPARMPTIYCDKENHITNIDCGCALLPALQEGVLFMDEFGMEGCFGICVLDLDKYAVGREDAVTYISGEED